MTRLVLFLVLAACGGKFPTTPNSPNSDDTAGGPDADGDGFTAEEGDCDDDDGDVNPGATETCDSIDNDCDDAIDEDVTQTYYEDFDQDGFGDPATPTEACEPTGTTVVSGTDCDDGDADRYPGNTEDCDGIDNDCDEIVDNGVSSTWYADADGDGFGDPDAASESCDPELGGVSNDRDCDDTSAASYPGNAEVCDELDNDCDDEVDEDVMLTWYVDADGDGHGDPSLTQAACSAPTGYAEAGDDCDDTASAVYPGATELCNGEDDDCDGTTDESDASDALTWYVDADADGYGDPTGGTRSCEAPSGYVVDATDCDDARAATNPGATEYCNSHDDDCDGTTDESDAADALTWYIDYDSDGYGSTRLTSVGCSAPSGYVGDSTDCDDTDVTSYPGGTEVCDEADNDCDGSTDEGLSVPTWYYDGDGDGWGDPDVSTEECTAPSSYVADAEDCDDGDATVSPDESEACDGIDNDCTGDADDGGVCPCDVDWYDDHPYMFCTSGTDWTTARSDCYTYGYHLVTVNDEDEDDWLISIVRVAPYSSASNPYYWIGYNDATTEGTWVWEDGSPDSYTDWNTGEPNSNGGNEDCAQLRYGTAHWNDWTCSNTCTYICEAD